MSCYIKAATLKRIFPARAFCVLLLLAIPAVPLAAQQLETQSRNDTGPALWELSDDDTKLYLFGFAPVLKNGTEWESAAITEVLESSNLFVVESDGSSQQAQAAVQKLIPKIGLNSGGKKLTDSLTRSQKSKLNDILSSKGVPLSALESLKPWLASVQLGVLSVSGGDYDLKNTPSSVLIEKAKAAGIKVSTLEDPSTLMKLLADFSEEEQVGMLMHAAKTISSQPDQQMQIAKAWMNGDVKEIGSLLHGSEGAWSSQTIYNAMLVERNKTWVAEIKRLMAEHEGTVFFAVGLGHLAGDDSLVKMLQDQGWTVHRK